MALFKIAAPLTKLGGEDAVDGNDWNRVIDTLTGGVQETVHFISANGNDLFMQDAGGNITINPINGKVLAIGNLSGNNVDQYLPILMKQAVAYISLFPTGKFYFDGVGDSYDYESAANQVDRVVGGSVRLRMTSNRTRFGDSGYSINTESADLVWRNNADAEKMRMTDGGIFRVGGGGTSYAKISVSNAGFDGVSVENVNAGGSVWGLFAADTGLGYTDTGVIIYKGTGGSGLGGGDSVPVLAFDKSHKFYIVGSGLHKRQLLYVDNAGTPWLGNGDISLNVGTNLLLQSPYDVVIASGRFLRLDGSLSGDSYIVENSANVVDYVAGGTVGIRYDQPNAVVAIQALLRPWTDNARNLGDPSFYWKDAYIKRIGHGSSTTLTVASNTITITQAYHKVDTSGGAQTINTINGGITGQLLFLQRSGANNLIIADSGTNVQTAAGRTLNADDDIIALFYNGTTWLEIGFGDNA